jgi:SET domain-containing protein
MDISIYLNHSKDPNVRFNKKNVLEAIKDIPRGEELLLDYDISFGAKHFF